MSNYFTILIITLNCFLFSRREGSVVATIVITLNRRFKDNPSTLVNILNKVDTLAGYRLDTSYTKEEGDIILTPKKLIVIK